MFHQPYAGFSNKGIHRSLHKLLKLDTPLFLALKVVLILRSFAYPPSKPFTLPFLLIFKP